MRNTFDSEHAASGRRQCVRLWDDCVRCRSPLVDQLRLVTELVTLARLNIRPASVTLRPLQPLHRVLQRLPVRVQVRPEITDLGDAGGHRAQRERPWANLAAFDLFPCARR